MTPIQPTKISDNHLFIISDGNITEIQDHVKTRSNLEKRPSIVLIHFPENQLTFSKKRKVPGANSYSEAVKSKMNSQNIKIFSNRITKGIRVRQFNQSVKTGNARIHSFPRSTSK